MLYHLLAFCSLGLPLLVPLGVNSCREWVLEGQGNLVHHKDNTSQDNARWLAEPECTAEETHGAAVIHWCIRHVKGESGDHVIHEDAEIVAEVGARDSESPHRREYEDVTAGQESICKRVRERCLEERVAGLCAEGAFIAADPSSVTVRWAVGALGVLLLHTWHRV